MTKKSKKAQANVVSFMEMVDGMSDARRKTQMGKLDAGFDTRAAFEATHAPANSSIQAKIATYRRSMVLPGIAALTLAANIDPEFMNKSGNNANKRFNVYAIAKLADLLAGINSGDIKNAINKAIVQSLFKFSDASVPFTGLAAQAAVSQNLKVGKDMSGLLVRHTAAESTAPTQSSSTMNALVALGAVKNIGSAKHQVWQLTDAPVVTRLKEVAAAV